MTYGSSLEALADPTRRAIFELLRERPRPVGELAEHVPVSRPAVSQHLRVLEGAGLVSGRKDGTRRVYRVERTGLVELRNWVETFWDEALAGFRAAAESERRKR